MIRHLAIEGGPMNLQLKYLATDAFDAVFSHIPYGLMDRAAEPLIRNAVSREVAFVNAAPFTGGLLLQGREDPSMARIGEGSRALLERRDKMRMICAAYRIPWRQRHCSSRCSIHGLPQRSLASIPRRKPSFVTDLAQWRIPAAAWDDLLDLVEEADLAVSCRNDVIPNTNSRLSGISM